MRFKSRGLHRKCSLDNDVFNTKTLGFLINSKGYLKSFRCYEIFHSQPELMAKQNYNVKISSCTSSLVATGSSADCLLVVQLVASSSQLVATCFLQYPFKRDHIDSVDQRSI